MAMSAAQALVATLRGHGVDRVFCVPGESYLPVLDALGDETAIDLITCRHESGAGYMAVADAKLTGKPGICFVSRGPGATNASIAVHTAEQDAVPLLLFIGQVPRRDIGRGAFQEIDYARMFDGIAKQVTVVSDPDEMSASVAEAFRVACEGTPGPVVVVLPEDVLPEPSDGALVPQTASKMPELDGGKIDRILSAVRAAERPLLIAGGGVGSREGRAALKRAAEALAIPVVPTFKRQDLFPNAHANYCGYLGFKIPKTQVELLQESDLILAVGTRLGDVTTQGYSFPAAPRPRQTLIHVHADSAVVGRVYQTDHAMVGDPVAFLLKLAETRVNPTSTREAWRARLHDGMADAMRWRAPDAPADGVVFGEIVAALKDRLAADAILITDAGNFSTWVHRYFPFGEQNFLIGAVSGAMGMGVPAAVAAGLRAPGRQIVSFIGDGGFLMTGNELATAIQHRVPVRLFVSNNRSYGTIRMHQEKFYPGRGVATELVNPDFSKLGEAFGARGLSINGTSDVAPVVEAALRHDGPVVVDVRTSLHHISAYATIDDLRAFSG